MGPFSRGNTKWLTRNPLMKSGSVASKLRYGAMAPMSSPGTTSPSDASTKKADQWKTTQSFGRNDLLVLAKVADQAHSRIFALPQEEEPEAEAES